MNTAIVLTIVIVWTGCMMFMAWALINLRAELDKRTDQLAMEVSRRRRTEKEAQELVEKVTPLIEQTDWMTGRWHGRFQDLQRMEADRNAAVVTARRAMWEIPLVADYLKNTYGASK